MTKATPAQTATPANPLLIAVLNLSKFHRDHEKYYSSSPREQAVVLQRHARTLLALADRWSTAVPTHRQVLSPYEAAEDLRAGGDPARGRALPRRRGAARGDNEVDP